MLRKKKYIGNFNNIIIVEITLYYEYNQRRKRLDRPQRRPRTLLSESKIDLKKTSLRKHLNFNLGRSMNRHQYFSNV